MNKVLMIAGLTLALCACAPTTTNTDTSSSSAPAAKRMPMVWVAEQTGTGSMGEPQNVLTLQVENSGEILFSTACMGVPSPEIQDAEGSVASMQCWWAGGGDQYAVFIGDHEELLIMYRTVDEEAGFGEWKQINE